ncbi:MAG: hypothetical protein IJ760_08850, partial [Bacteroidales bacterium]|nr:hypothetical protein [Bacteroidales bacterium]
FFDCSPIVLRFNIEEQSKNNRRTIEEQTALVRPLWLPGVAMGRQKNGGIDSFLRWSGFFYVFLPPVSSDGREVET